MAKNFNLQNDEKNRISVTQYKRQTIILTMSYIGYLLVSQLAQRRCDNVVTTSLLTLSQRCGTVENESCTDVSFRRCDNVALQRCQDVASTLLQRSHNIRHWISTRSFYYGLLWFLSLHRNVKVTKVLSGIKHASFLFKKTLYL